MKDHFDKSHITVHNDLIQGTDEWLEARLGVLTASEMSKVITPTLKVANNADSRAHVFDIASQRLTNHIEPGFISDKMQRGHDEEELAVATYSEHVAPVARAGFITNDKWGFTLGYSPDGIVGDDGLLECKSRDPKYQIQTIIEHVVENECKTIPKEYMLQCQTGLLVSEREWLDFISYSGGLHMAVIRVYPDEEIQKAIIDAATNFEVAVQSVLSRYAGAINSGAQLDPTTRVEVEEV